MKYIRRSIEDVIENSAQSFKAVLVTGARQTGKLTLLQELFPKRKTITFEDQFLEDQARENPDMFLVLNAPPVTMDEVQRVPELFRYIKMSCDRSEEKGQFLLSGSQPFRLMELASDSLAGRVSVIELAPLSLCEIMGDPSTLPFVPTLEYVKERAKTAKAPANIWEIIHRGGYPQLQDPEMDWQIYFASYVKTYLERDVRELSAVQDLDTFRRFMCLCSTDRRNAELQQHCRGDRKRCRYREEMDFHSGGVRSHLYTGAVYGIGSEKGDPHTEIVFS